MENYAWGPMLAIPTSTVVPVVLICLVNATHVLVVVLEYSWAGYLDYSLFASPFDFLVSLWCVWGMRRLMNCTKKIYWFVVIPGYSSSLPQLL